MLTEEGRHEGEKLGSRRTKEVRGEDIQRGRQGEGGRMGNGSEGEGGLVVEAVLMEMQL